MHLFGLCFLLYIIKISAPKGMWYTLRTADPVAHKAAIAYQRRQQRLMKAELDLKFLLECRDKKLFPTHVKWKILKKFKPRDRQRHHERNLKESISTINEKIRKLKPEYQEAESDFRKTLTWMKFTIFKISIRNNTNRMKEKIAETHRKKLDKLLVDKAVREGTTKNPHKLITNLTDITLTNEEVEVLTLGLNHGLALRPREEDILPAIEGLFSRIKESNLIKENYMASERIKNALRSFAWNLVDLDDRHFYNDSKKTRIIKGLRKRAVILKPDKGQGIVLLKKEDYVESMERIFADRSKFKEVETDNTISRVENLKRYLNTLLNRGEITESEKKEMRMKGANRARARGLPKTHKSFDTIPPFRPIVDTTNTPYSGIGSYLKKLLYPLTLNEYSMKDSFQAAEEIKKIDPESLHTGYKLVSFDVVSLFTNVPLKRTINIIVDRIYKEKKIETKLRKQTLKKLVLDCCTKTTFSFNERLYDQIDGVCMGSALGPVLANIIMTELERIILPKLIESDIIRFYIRYVDDTLVLIKEDRIDEVLAAFNSFDQNLQFTVDEFDDGLVHFLDLNYDVTTGEIDVYSKPTNTGQYSHESSYVPWNYKISWAKALYERAKRICSTESRFKGQRRRIADILSWNGFPKFCRNKILKRFDEDFQKKTQRSTEQQPEPEAETSKFILKIPYLGKNGENLARVLKRKLARNLKEKVSIRIVFTTNKLSRFCGVKDHIPDAQKNGVIYRIRCPGCGESYVGKTECCLDKRLEEHARLAPQPMHQHLQTCTDYQHIVGLFHLPEACQDSMNVVSNKDVGLRGRKEADDHSNDDFFLESLRDNTEVLATSADWLTLAYLEPLMAKKHDARINGGEKAMRTLNLF